MVSRGSTVYTFRAHCKMFEVASTTRSAEFNEELLRENWTRFIAWRILTGSYGGLTSFYQQYVQKKGLLQNVGDSLPWTQGRFNNWAEFQWCALKLLRATEMGASHLGMGLEISGIYVRFMWDLCELYVRFT